MSVSIEMDASDALAKLDRYLQKFEDYSNIVEEEVTKGTEAMVSLAKYYCPIRTGRLQKSIRYEGDYPNFMLIADAQNEYGQGYSRFVEFGTSRQIAQPYMWPAVNAILPDMVLQLRGRIRNFLRG